MNALVERCQELFVRAGSEGPHIALPHCSRHTPDQNMQICERSCSGAGYGSYVSLFRGGVRAGKSPDLAITGSSALP